MRLRDGEADVEWFRMAVNWVHLTAAVVWLGGVAFHALGLNPADDSSGRSRRGGPRAAALAAFSPVAWTCVAALIASGVAKLHWHVDTTYVETLQTPWGRLLMTKWAVAALLIASGAYIRYVLLPQITHDSRQPTRRSTAARIHRLVRHLAWANFALALCLLLIVTLL